MNKINAIKEQEKQIPAISFYHLQIIGVHGFFEKRYQDMLRIRRKLESIMV